MSPPSEFGNVKDIIHSFRETSQPANDKDAETLTPFTQNANEIPSDYSYDYSRTGVNALKISDGCKIIAGLTEIFC